MVPTAGFRIGSYTPATAVIDVASHCPDSTLQATVQTVTWDGADWQLVLQPNGDDGTAPRELTDLTGFVPMFPGVDYTPLAG